MTTQTQAQRITALAQAIGADVKKLLAQDGNLTALKTTDKTNLVASLNELHDLTKGLIDDRSTNAIDKTWSVQKISTEIATKVRQAKEELINGSVAALDTLKELADALGNDANFATTMATALGNRIRVDEAQTFTPEQKAQACANIGIGDLNTDFVALYNQAKT